MTKPIFIIRYPRFISGNESVGIHEMNKTMDERFRNEYHTLAIPIANEEEYDWKFEMFNGENVSEIEFEELKKKVFEAVGEMKSKEV